MDYLVFDIETHYGESNGRVGNRWDPEFGLCSIGWKPGKGEYDDAYTVDERECKRMGRRPDMVLPFPDLSDISLLVGHNIKFDLLWYWDHPEVIQFFKRGGTVWDTMYAEYLLSAQFYSQQNRQEGMGISLSACAKRRGLAYQKLDVVKALWDKEVRTEDIEEAILLEYQKYDVLTTEELFLAQIKQAREQDQVHMIKGRMEGLLATTEMEFNGMHIDQVTAEIQMDDLSKDIEVLGEDLEKYIPELPKGCEFKWGSWRNISALIFGGYLKYTGLEFSLDDEGQKQYYKCTIQETILDAGEPVLYKSGKNQGKIKTKKKIIPDIARGPKTRQCDKYYKLPGMAEPKEKWKSSTLGYWSTAEDILVQIDEEQGVPLVKNLLELKGYLKDLGTYYKRFSKGKWTGMLTNIQPDGCVHGQLNHSITVTSRLSSSKPNLQNIPKKGKSLIKKTFTSRFPEGVVSEIDYSQLEVVCKGVISQDRALLQALIDKVCFHCEWAAFITGKPYDFVYHKVKVEEDAGWIEIRQNAKPITFGEAYGAGIPHLCEQTGLDADTIDKAIKARKLKYVKMYQFDEDVKDAVQKSRQITTLRTDDGYQRAIGYYRSCTGTIYSFLEGDAPAWRKSQGVHTAFSPTQMKNYPSQGIGGEIMQVQAGRVWRYIIQNELQHDILLTNTVHDSLYTDIRSEEIAQKYLPVISGILEDVCPYFNRMYPEVHWDTPFPVDTEYGKNIMEANIKITERITQWQLK